jgi:hypothetical protein
MAELKGLAFVTLDRIEIGLSQLRRASKGCDTYGQVSENHYQKVRTLLGYSLVGLLHLDLKRQRICI